MQIVEYTEDKLVLYFHRSLVKGLAIGISFALGGLFFCLFGILLFQQAEGVWIMSFGIRSALIVVGIFWIVKFPKVSTFTFDKSRNCILREQRTLLSHSVNRSFEFPSDLIAGVAIATSELTETTAYYPTLILDRIYWRINLDSDGHYDTAATIAKTIARFLNVNYFPDESKTPLPTWKQKMLERAQPYQPGWKYLEEEIDRLRQHLSQYPFNARIHLELGILLRSNRKDATVSLKQAENLFEAQQDLDLAALARVLQDLAH
jgi:hypothetical protein